jgi:hypothetical protein
MKAKLVAAIALALGLHCSAQAQTGALRFPAGPRLVQFCASEAGDYHDGFCMGYLLGLASGLDGHPGTGVCVPGGTTARQVRNRAVAYLRGHLQTQQQDAPIAVATAMRGSFPCRK